MKRTTRVVTLFLAVLLAGIGCSAGTPVQQLSSNGCPATIELQSWWTPQSENGYLYQGLIGPGGKPVTYTVDSKRSRVSGPLYDAGKPTGLRMTIRAGGPILNYASTPTLMATDHSIFIGQVATLEDQIAAYAKGGRLDTVGVFAPLESDPRAVMWDEQRHPDVHSLRDVGTTDMPVYSLPAAMSTEHLVATGVLRTKQIDPSGNDTHRFVTNRNAATTGYVTNELDFYRSRGIRVGFDMIANSFPTYSDPLVVRAGDLDAYSGCLDWLVPVMQRNLRRFVATPGPAVKMVSDLSRAYIGEDYPVRRGLAAVATARNLGIVGNGPNSVLGAFTPTRVGDVLSIVRSIQEARHITLPADLTADRLVTNRFLDTSISLESS